MRPAVDIKYIPAWAWFTQDNNPTLPIRHCPLLQDFLPLLQKTPILDHSHPLWLYMLWKNVTLFVSVSSNMFQLFTHEKGSQWIFMCITEWTPRIHKHSTEIWFNPSYTFCPQCKKEGYVITVHVLFHHVELHLEVFIFYMLYLFMSLLQCF